MVLSLGMDGPNVNKSILESWMKRRRRKVSSHLSDSQSVVLIMCVTIASANEENNMVTMLKSYA